jgi:LysM repeat protein
MARVGATHKGNTLENKGRETTRGSAEVSGTGSRGGTSYFSREKALEQIAQARNRADSASQAVSELRVKLDAQRQEHEQTVARLEQEEQKRQALEKEVAAIYISKKSAKVQIAQARNRADSASQAVSELQVKLDAQRQEHEQTVTRLGQDRKKRRHWEQASVIDERFSSLEEARQKMTSRKPAWEDEAPVSAAPESQETIASKTVRETVHEIREGENLFRIGIKYDVSWKALLKYNNLTNASVVYVGQELRIPRSEKSE